MFLKSGKSSKVFTEENQVFQKSDSSIKLGSLENIMNRPGSFSILANFDKDQRSDFQNATTMLVTKK